MGPWAPSAWEKMEKGWTSVEMAWNGFIWPTVARAEPFLQSVCSIKKLELSWASMLGFSSDFACSKHSYAPVVHTCPNLIFSSASSACAHLRAVFHLFPWNKQANTQCSNSFNYVQQLLANSTSACVSFHSTTVMLDELHLLVAEDPF